jgi:hypothetical protein
MSNNNKAESIREHLLTWAEHEYEGEKKKVLDKLGVHNNKDIGLFYKSQFHHMLSLSDENLQKIKALLEHDKSNHIADVMTYLKVENHNSDSSIYDDIKSRSKLPSLILDPHIRPTIFSKKVMGEISKHQQIKMEEIIYKCGIKHSMSELFSENLKLDQGFMANKEDPP